MTSATPIMAEGATTYRDEYCELLDEIRDAELAIEGIREELEPGLGEGPSTTQITACLAKMERYLGGTLREEYKTYVMANPPPDTPFGSPTMRIFIAH